MYQGQGVHRFRKNSSFFFWVLPLVHPTRCQIFAGKPHSAFYRIWDLLVYTRWHHEGLNRNEYRVNGNRRECIVLGCWVVSYPTRWSFSFILGPLHWSSIFLTSSEQRNIVQLCTNQVWSLVRVRSEFDFAKDILNTNQVNADNINAFVW